MLDALRRILDAEPGVAYALLFGSSARGTRRPDSDVDVAIELTASAARDVHALGGLAGRLESAAGRAPSSTTSTSSRSKSCVPPESCAPPRPVVDSALVAAKIAAALDATARVRAVLPASTRASLDEVFSESAAGEL